MKRFNRISAVLVALFIAHPAADAAGPLTTAETNARWNYAISSHTATFLGNDQAGPAVLDLKKASVLGGSVSIQTDAQAIHLSSGKAPELIIAVPSNPDGTTTALKMDGGDDPKIAIDSSALPRLQGKWIQLVHADAASLTITLENATFATVHLDLGPGAADAADAVPAAGVMAAPKDLVHDVKPNELILSEKRFATSVSRPCPHCQGTGSVTEQVQVGEHKEGAFIVPDYRDETHTCPVCSGTGHVRADNDVLKRLCGAFLKNLAHLDQNDPAAQDAISQSYDMITQSMIGDFKTWTMLNQNARSILSRPTPETGSPVVAQVKVIRCDEAQGGKKDFVVRVVGTDQEVHVANPVSADRLASGFALMGGLVDNSLVDANSAKKTPVVANGFLIAPPIEKTWYWWWDWRWNGRPD